VGEIGARPSVPRRDEWGVAPSSSPAGRGFSRPPQRSVLVLRIPLSGVRPGLVVVGVLLAVVGAATLLSVVVLPLAAPATAVSRSTETFVVPGQGTSSSGIHLPSASPQSLVISWASDRPLTVDLLPAAACPHGASGLCPDGTPVQQWSQTEGGSWSAGSGFAGAYLLRATAPSAVAATVNWTLVETSASVEQQLPLWSYAAFLAAGSGLLAIGAVGIFLGFFLRSGVYAGRPPVVPLGPEVLEEWAWASDPDAPDDPPGPP